MSEHLLNFQGSLETQSEGCGEAPTAELLPTICIAVTR